MHGRTYALECDRRGWGEGRREEKRVFIPSNSIYLFKYLTRSSNKFSQLANQMFLTEIWDSLLLLRRFFLQTWFTRNWNSLSYWILLLSDITLLITTNENIAKVSTWQKFRRARKNQKFINLLNFFHSLICFRSEMLRFSDSTRQKLINDSIKIFNNSISNLFWLVFIECSKFGHFFLEHTERLIWKFLIHWRHIKSDDQTSRHLCFILFCSFRHDNTRNIIELEVLELFFWHWRLRLAKNKKTAEFFKKTFRVYLKSSYKILNT